MINWPEFLRRADDWADGFWAGTATACVVGLVGAAVVLLSRAI
jgi:hypothetical protein